MIKLISRASRLVGILAARNKTQVFLKCSVAMVQSLSAFNVQKVRTSIVMARCAFKFTNDNVIINLLTSLSSIFKSVYSRIIQYCRSDPEYSPRDKVVTWNCLSRLDAECFLCTVTQHVTKNRAEICRQKQNQFLVDWQLLLRLVE